MRWRPGSCEPGDPIRIHLGAICHYGVYIADDEVIQFGDPPLETLDRDDASIAVCRTDIDSFSCGRIVEIGKAEKGDGFTRRPTAEIIRTARARVGEKGYSLLHNNCEHFTFECVYGVHYCELEEAARSRLRSRPVLDVYVSLTADRPDPERMPVCEARRAEIARTKDPGLRDSRTADWLLLEDALFRSLGLRADRLTFDRSLNGKWRCGEAFFSLSRTERFVCAAVSNRPVGVDLEESDAFLRRFGSLRDPERLADRICSPGEERPRDLRGAMLLWMKKECLYKVSDAFRFAPKKIRTTEADTLIAQPGTDPETVLAVAGEHLHTARIWVYRNGQWENRTTA